ncbi:hypothetical protein [Novipirellula rosea]|uniref:Hemolysin, chromosomal n=1 Tax=Novipirellula rosea TaxID=1031540 RepID=A0ABP8MSH5_9BACT
MSPKQRRTPRTKSQRNTARKNLRLESLERRELMAGDVSVLMNSGTLHVQGDAQANVIEIQQLRNGDFRISSEDGGATKINGRKYVDVDGRSVKSMMIDMGEGDDYFYAHDFDVFDLGVLFGNGNDAADIIRITTRDDLTIDSGDTGDDTFALMSSQIGSDAVANNDLTIRGNSHTQTAVITNVVVQDDVYAYLASSNLESDSLFIQDLTVEGESYGGLARLRAQTINGGSIDVTGDIDIDYAGTIDLHDLSASDDIWVNTTNGNDQIELDVTNVNDQFVIYAYDGHDEISVTSNDSVRVYGGNGNDTIRGGSGNDTLIGGNGHDIIFGNAGGDTLQGDGGDDALYGGSGADNLDGGSGNDGLFGGSDFDLVAGGTGADRFLSWLTAGSDSSPSDPDTLKDVDAEDATIKFKNGVTSTFTIEGTDTAYPGKDWSDSDIERLDVALAALHRATDNTTLLKTAAKQDIMFERFSGELRGFNSGTRIVLSDKQFNRTEDYLRCYVVHEIGHFWDVENPYWNEFQSLSGWTPKDTNPDASTYDQAGNGSDWYYLKSANFTSGYAKNSPRDDFAEAFTAYFAQAEGWNWYLSGNGAIDAPEKVTLIEGWINEL